MFTRSFAPPATATLRRDGAPDARVRPIETRTASVTGAAEPTDEVVIEPRGSAFTTCVLANLSEIRES